jgi:hypothetical protein
VTVKLSRAVARRLVRRGGSVSVIAATVGSALTPHTRTVTVHAPKHRKHR